MFVAGLVTEAVAMQGRPFRPYRRPVIIWEPPYAVAKSEKALPRPGVAEAITHRTLQFWVPRS